MIRLAERQDLDRIMEIWLEGNLQAIYLGYPYSWCGFFLYVGYAIALVLGWVWE